MTTNLLSYTPSELLDLFKSSFYTEHGTPMIIGSDDFTASATFTYVMSVLVNAINVAGDQRFIESATGEFLDAIAGSLGLSRPAAARARAVFHLTPTSTGTLSADGLQVSDASGHVFSNPERVTVSSGVEVDVLLYCTEAGSAGNGIAIGAIDNIIAGSNQLSAATNTTMSGGGDDGYPYTAAGDQAFREYLLNRRGYFPVGGSAPAYKSKCLEIGDKRLLDVHVLQDGETGFVQGKVKIYTLWDLSTLSSLAARLLNEKILALCTAADFKPIGDYVEIALADAYNTSLGAYWIVKYRLRDKDVAEAHMRKVFDDYATYLARGFNRPFSEAELVKRFCTPDENGVAALGFDITDASAKYQMPAPGRYYHFSPPLSIWAALISAGRVQFIDTEA